MDAAKMFSCRRQISVYVGCCERARLLLSLGLTWITCLAPQRAYCWYRGWAVPVDAAAAQIHEADGRASGRVRTMHLLVRRKL